MLDLYPRDPEIAEFSFFTDQFALALALSGTGIPYRTLPLEMNFPTHQAVHPSFMSPEFRALVVHHHHKIDPAGTLAHCGYENVNRLIDQFNSSLESAEINPYRKAS